MADAFGTIKLIDQTGISLSKWKKATAGAGLYADPGFMSAMAGKWAAFVLNDYEAVLPVFPKKKAGIRYLRQPPFIQKTAVYSNQPTSPDLIDLFLFHCQEHFKFAEFSLANPLNQSNLYIKERNNYHLPLLQSYAEITSNYKNDLRKNRKIASQYPFVYKVSEDPGKILRLYQDTYGRSLGYKKQDFERLLQYCNSKAGKSFVVAREVCLQEHTQAACLCLKDDQRLYLLVNVTIPQARKRSANHFLLDQLIREFTGRLTWLDLEGSDIPGIAHFYKNFGAINDPYYFIAWNKLPVCIRWLKHNY